MKIGAIFCACAGQITEKIDFEKLNQLIINKVEWLEKFELACSEETQKEIKNLLTLKKPDGLIILACSPKNKESLFQSIVAESGINPYMINFVNIREQVAWATKDKQGALKKTYALFNGALERLKKQRPLFEKEFPVSKDIMVVGGGIAGLKAALALSKAGRKVYLIEKEDSLGGKIVKYEKLFPDLSCGPCMVHPMIEEVLNSNIELRLNSELKELKGFFGSFFAKVISKPVYVNPEKCIGCSQCEEVCPVNAIRVEPMKLPAVARINPEKCLALKGEDCNLCIKECPVDAINFHESEKEENIKINAILWATGFELMDCKAIPELGYGKFKDIYNALEFEEILNSEGPTKGEIITSSGQSPQRIAIIHCVGSLDENYYPYCSKICCQYAFKFNRIIRHTLPDAEIIHFVKEIVLPGKKAYKLYQQAIKDPLTKIFRYENLKNLKINRKNLLIVSLKKKKFPCDIVVLCPAVVSDKNLEEPSGVFLTGSVKEPMTTEEAITDAMAQVGKLISSLKDNKIIKQPFIAKIDYNKCSSCGICLSLCPYGAIELEKNRPKIVEVLCEGCGICVPACASKAIELDGYTSEEFLAEIDGILKALEEVNDGSDFA
ncbi:FAD-dependent oxidoreductase [Thermodesulfovibrio sp.]|uniref:FAD-dependent oxidoreductase n=1 Tax=Thermodesulfovibrio sp. TaxID=2067987 RepID=UPI003D12AD5E